jgi:hypothetical protein
MKGSRLTAAVRPAVGLITACGCLSLGACAGSSPSAQPDAAKSSPAISAATQKFCRQIDNVLDSVDGRSLTHAMTLAIARTDEDDMVKAVITDFKRLEAQAPAGLRRSVRDVVAAFRAFKRKSDKASSVGQLIADGMHGSPVQARSYLRVLAYAGRAC